MKTLVLCCALVVCLFSVGYFPVQAEKRLVYYPPPSPPSGPIWVRGLTARDPQTTKRSEDKSRRGWITDTWNDIKEGVNNIKEEIDQGVNEIEDNLHREFDRIQNHFAGSTREESKRIIDTIDPWRPWEPVRPWDPPIYYRDLEASSSQARREDQTQEQSKRVFYDPVSHWDHWNHGSPPIYFRDVEQTNPQTREVEAKRVYPWSPPHPWVTPAFNYRDLSKRGWLSDTWNDIKDGVNRIQDKIDQGVANIKQNVQNTWNRINSIVNGDDDKREEQEGERAARIYDPTDFWHVHKG